MAFQLAVDLGQADLFLDLCHWFRRHGDENSAIAALAEATSLLNGMTRAFLQNAIYGFSYGPARRELFPWTDGGESVFNDADTMPSSMSDSSASSAQMPLAVSSIYFFLPFAKAPYCDLNVVSGLRTGAFKGNGKQCRT